MIKKILAITLALTVAILAPDVATAANNTKPKIKSMDLTLPVPTPGSTLEAAREAKLTSAKTQYGDLAPSGEISINSIDWIGEFKEDNEGNMFFKDGLEYKVLINVLIDPSGKYTTDYVFSNNNYWIDGTRISATLNGEKASVLRSSPYVIKVEKTIKIGSGGSNSELAKAKQAPTTYELNKDSYRASQVAYSTKEADSNCPDTNPFDLIVINDNSEDRFCANSQVGPYSGQKTMLVTKVLVDTSQKDIYTGIASDVTNSVQGAYNIREVWISDKVDVNEFIQSMYNMMRTHFSVDTKTNICNVDYSMLFYSGRATLFIPESAKATLMARFKKPTWTFRVFFNIKTYTGDVYAAQKAGAKAAKPFCTSHTFTDKVAAADKIYKYGTCNTPNVYYYSCRLCGQCEHNAAHTFSYGNTSGTNSHSYELPLANDQAYIGQNAAGNHVWWYSCIWDGHSQGYALRNISQKEWKNSGNAATYAQFKEAMLQQAKYTESNCIRGTKEEIGTFILRYKSKAKMSSKYQSSVNFALNDDLIDDNVLGQDYTTTLTQLQLRSLAVRLAEELLDKEITVDKKAASQFNDDYSAKAYAMGILNGPFAPSSIPASNVTATRQDVAAMIYATLRYIEKQGQYCYTNYDSHLANYTDRSKIASWANEPMAFMDALGLLTGTSKTLLAPDATCSIETAIDVAEKSTHAHQLGWYQARNWAENKGRHNDGSEYLMPVSGTRTNHFISSGERVWVTGPRLGFSWDFLPITDCYSGQTMYLKAEWFRPVRNQVFKSDRTIVKPLFMKAHFDGEDRD